MKNIVKVFVVSTCLVGALSLFGCGSETPEFKSDDGTRTTQESNALLTESTDTANIDAAVELLGNYCDFDIPTEAGNWTVYTSLADNGENVVRAMMFTDDGEHSAFVAFDEKTHVIHGLDVDTNNLVNYDETLRSVL